MTERVAGAWRRVWPRVALWALVVFSVGTCVNFVLIGLVLNRQGDQADQGTAARMVQCEVRPVQIKEQNWFHAHGWITEAERQKFIRALPTAEQCAALTEK